MLSNLMPQIVIKQEVKNILNKLKLVAEETYNSVIVRLINGNKRRGK